MMEKKKYIAPKSDVIFVPELMQNQGFGGGHSRPVPVFGKKHHFDSWDNEDGDTEKEDSYVPGMGKSALEIQEPKNGLWDD